jgi:excisionase family DNA binding protein
MPSDHSPPSWLCGPCGLTQEQPYRPPISADARCRVCGEGPAGCDLLRFDVAALRLTVEDLRTRLLVVDRRPVADDTDLLTPEEATKYLKLPSVRALYQYVRRGLVKALRIGRQLRFRRAELDRVLAGG